MIQGQRRRQLVLLASDLRIGSIIKVVGALWPLEAEVDEARLVGMEREPIPGKTLAQNSQNPRGIGESLESHHESSSGGDLHPSALSEPDVRLSPHPAPTLQPPAARPAATGQTGWDRGRRCAPASA